MHVPWQHKARNRSSRQNVRMLPSSSWIVSTRVPHLLHIRTEGSAPALKPDANEDRRSTLCRGAASVTSWLLESSLGSSGRQYCAISKPRRTKQVQSGENVGISNHQIDVLVLTQREIAIRGHCNYWPLVDYYRKLVFSKKRGDLDRFFREMIVSSRDLKEAPTQILE